jgi:hypothetical protein
MAPCSQRPELTTRHHAGASEGDGLSVEAGYDVIHSLERMLMHLEFRPSDAPEPTARVRVPAGQITTELLKLCEEFLRPASPIVHTELRQFLAEHGHHGGIGWFLDALGFTTLSRTILTDRHI